MKKLTYITALLVLTSCITTSNISTTVGVDRNKLDEIPLQTNAIVLELPINSADAYEMIITETLKRGHRIDREDKNRLYIATEGKDVGMSTLQRMTITINDNGNGCTARFITDWKGGTEATAMANSMSGIPMSNEWTLAYWDYGRPNLAMAETIAIADNIESGKITYIIE